MIEFGTKQFELVMWSVIQTRPFQRLRRIKQLGFSDLVYPGATHTRFAHSIGVFHTARQLMRVIEGTMSSSSFNENQAKVSLAAALVHDLGHGMFSHAFEDVGKTLGLKMAHHETVSDQLIRDGDVSEALKPLGSGFADDVADVIKHGRAGNLYNAVVSSQFDADRLDYVRRDQLMTGVQTSGIDFTWLLDNLEIGMVPSGVDDERLAETETFVLGPKGVRAAETYVLSLFQLYPTVYFHKTTRGAEKMFSVLMTQLITLVSDGSTAKTGLPRNHPIVRFAKKSDSLDNALALDDTVFWGALPMMAAAKDPLIANYATRLRERRLLKCIDIRECLIEAIEQRGICTEKQERSHMLARLTETIRGEIEAWNERRTAARSVLVDRTERDPYKRFQEAKGPLNQIRLKTTHGRILDLAEKSPTVAGIETFHLFRAYMDEDDQEARTMIETRIEQALRSNGDATS